jgi:hypothetical protein
MARCLVMSMLLSFIDHIVCHFVCLQAPELLSMLFDLGKDHRLTIIYERSLFYVVIVMKLVLVYLLEAYLP